MKYEFIKTAAQLDDWCRDIADCQVIGFDTEFVSEDRYRPQLCLIQVAAGGRLAVIDPLAMGSTEPFWRLIAEPGRTVIAHAAREESRFCYRYTDRPIAGLFDTQLAAGFVGLEYPASLATLVHRLLGRTLSKGESRTNWRNRPLSSDQLDYAVRDVIDLEAMYDQLDKSVRDLGRDAWVREEAASFQQAVIAAEHRENWHRVSGSSGLPPRQLEIVRQLWLWREETAKRGDQPPRRVLRDDLIVELARRGSPDVRKIRGIRGMERRSFSDHYEDISEAIAAALATPEDELPRKRRGGRRSVSPMLSQFLSTSIACVSRQHRLAPSIVGNADDVRDLLAYELEPRPGDDTPALLQGWRGEIVGKTFRRLLAGELAIRIADVHEPQPLEFIEPSPRHCDD